MHCSLIKEKLTLLENVWYKRNKINGTCCHMKNQQQVGVIRLTYYLGIKSKGKT